MDDITARALVSDPETRRALQLDALASILPMERRDRLADHLAADLLDAREAVALARSYRAAVIAERAAETAHTNAGPGARQPAMAAMLAARGVRTTAEARLGAALDGGR